MRKQKIVLWYYWSSYVSACCTDVGKNITRGEHLKLQIDSHILTDDDDDESNEGNSKVD